LKTDLACHWLDWSEDSQSSVIDSVASIPSHVTFVTVST